MDVETFVEIYKVLIIIAFSVSSLNWIGYTILAPWYRSKMGWIIWLLFLSIVLILFTPFLQVVYRTVPFRYEASLVAMTIFVMAISVVSYGIYTTQVKGYLIYRNQLRKSKKLIKEEEEL